MNTKNDKYKDYKPETMEYDPKIDGGDEHLIRDAHLAEKDRLHDVIAKIKKRQRGDDKKVRR